jgi:hypothetical protein
MKTSRVHSITILRIIITVIACYFAAWLVSFACLQSAVNEYDKVNSQNDSSVFLYVYTKAYLKSLPSNTLAKIKNIPEPQSPPNQETPTGNSPFIWVMIRNTITLDHMPSALSSSTAEYVGYTSNVLNTITPLNAKLATQ